MKHIKTFESEQINEFGGSTGDVMLPKIKELVKYLTELEKKFDKSDGPHLIDSNALHKVERMHSYIIDNVPLEVVYKTLMQVRKKINPDAQ